MSDLKHHDGGKEPHKKRRLLASKNQINKITLGLVAVLAVASGIYVVTRSQAATAQWLSGSSGNTAGNGTFATWRGEPIGIAGTWSDDNANMVGLWQLDPGGTYGSWQKNLDIAVGAIGPGESWGAAATGAYDARWRQSLTNLKAKWASRPGTVFIRFAHEMNGSWYSWKVVNGQQNDFINAWKRYRNLQKQIFPQSKLVFCVNRESNGSGFDWRKSVPGYADGTTKQWVDVGCVDYYNQYPAAKSQAEFDQHILQSDGYGAPKGLEMHRKFWESQGLPIGIGEWNNNGSNQSYAAGDAPAFMNAMYNYFATHAGTGPGKLWYEVLFNAQDSGQPQFWTYPQCQQPNTCAAYRNLVWPSATSIGSGGGSTPAPSTPTPTATATATPVPTTPTPSSVPGTKADLTITGVSTSPVSPQPGGKVRFSAMVKNQGTAAVPAGTVIGVAFEVGGAKLWSDTFTTGLAAGASVALEANGGTFADGMWPADVAGAYTVKVTVDDINRIAESNETNNTRDYNFTVGGTATASPSPTTTPTKKGDLNRDGQVNATDLSILLGNWGKPAGDTNGDGTTNAADLSVLLSNWGS